MYLDQSFLSINRGVHSSEVKIYTSSIGKSTFGTPLERVHCSEAISNDAPFH